MKTRFAIAIFSLAFSLPLFGQVAAAPAVDQSTRDEVIRFMDLMQVRTRMIEVMDNMKVQMRRGAEQSLKLRKPDATQRDIERADSIVDVSMKDFPTDEMIEAMIPIYQRHFSKEDLDALIAFYTSPVGQKIQNETPALTKEAMQAGGDVMTKRLPEIQARIKEQVAKMAEEDKKAGAKNSSN